VLDTEIVGLTPQAAVSDTAQHYLQLRGFDGKEQILENLIERADAPSQDAARPGAGGAGAGGIGAEPVGAFLDAVASDAPTPGGGSVAAVTGAAGAALIAMVCRLTIGKKGSEAFDDRMTEIVNLADDSRPALLALADRDAAAFEGVMAAFKLPKDTDEQKAARSEAIQRATADAAAAPLEVARRSAALMDVVVEVIEHGNPNAASDGASAAAALHASVVAAVANVEINVASLKDAEESARMSEEAWALRTTAGQILEAAGQAFVRRLGS
jgi:formiminotetrahydrofolate cyclodeaminase